jgi:peptidyl-prolyl cis-trans isomerase B (cyclophilin B)
MRVGLKHFLTIAILVLAASSIAAQSPTPSSDNLEKTNARPSASPSPSANVEAFNTATVPQMSGQCVTLDTEQGAIVIEMLPEKAPQTVRNFLNLAASGALDTTTFSRVVKGFVIQGGNLSTSEHWGDELATRMQKTLADEPNDMKHVRGIVSMARGDEPNTATTHFFILVGDGPHLDGKFAAFGRVLRGMEVADAINRAESADEKPVVPVRIKHASVSPCEK